MVLLLLRDGRWENVKGVILVVGSSLDLYDSMSDGAFGVHWDLLVYRGTDRSSDLRIKRRGPSKGDLCISAKRGAEKPHKPPTHPTFPLVIDHPQAIWAIQTLKSFSDRPFDIGECRNDGGRGGRETDGHGGDPLL